MFFNTSRIHSASLVKNHHILTATIPVTISELKSAVTPFEPRSILLPSENFRWVLFPRCQQ